MPVKFILFDISDKLVSAWNESFPAIVPKDVLENITIKEASMEDLGMPFDTVVSPANSFGRLDGSFDQVLSDSLAPEDDNDALTKAGQAVLYTRWRGYAPPGTCTLIPLADTKCASNTLGVHYVALCPTMRFPGNVRWHREVVYSCVWSLLVEVDNHNTAVAADPEGAARKGLRAIETVAMTGLATGVGRVPADMCARQMAQAFAHYSEAVAKPEKWGALLWEDISYLPVEPPQQLPEPSPAGCTAA